MNWIMELFTMDNGRKMGIEKEREFKFGKMGVSMSVTGKQIRLTVKADLFMLMETITKVNGSTISHKVEVSIGIQMEQCMLEIGKKIDKMASV